MQRGDLALGLRVVRSAANMVHTFGLETFGQVADDLRGAIIAERCRPMDEGCLIAH